MKKEILITGDGSRTIHMPELNESYHSTHGALQEALHVFISNGLDLIDSKKIKVFELGFGTGLNAILTYRYSNKKNTKIHYVGVEAFPVDKELMKELEYTSFLENGELDIFQKMHESNWGEKIVLSDTMSFEKVHKKVEEYESSYSDFDIVFFDAFGPRTQGELWKPEVLEKVGGLLKQEGILVTYCAQGQFRRDLKSVGFNVTKVPGPPGKREMTVAFKL